MNSQKEKQDSLLLFHSKLFAETAKKNVVKRELEKNAVKIPVSPREDKDNHKINKSLSMTLEVLSQSQSKDKFKINANLDYRLKNVIHNLRSTKE